VDEEPDGLVLGASASLSETTFESGTDPRSGYSWALSGGPSVLYQADEVTLAAFAEVRATGVLEVTPGHVLAAHLRFTSLFGELATTQGLPIGGVGTVRAFGTYAATGRHRSVARVEWRHRLTRDFSWNLMRLFWVQAIDGVVFVDAALLAESPEELVEASSVYLGAGYGLRFHYLVGGIYPMVFLLDVALPVVDGGHLGATTGPGFSTVFGVGQAF
jgi:hemolysin activation/secretion protein